MEADLERTLLVHAATELSTASRLPLGELATAIGVDLEEVTAAVEELASKDLVEVEDGAVVRVTSTGLAEVEAAG